MISDDRYRVDHDDVEATCLTLSMVAEWDMETFYNFTADVAGIDAPTQEVYLRRIEKSHAIISGLEHDEKGIEWGCLRFGVR